MLRLARTALRASFAPLVDAFAQEHVSPYLNLHRPCLFATEHEGANDRIRRVYRAAEQ